MKQLSLIQKITDLLVQSSLEVQDKGKLKLIDINIISEDVLVPILSIAYNTALKNLNTESTNYPGIDLASDEHLTFGGTEKIAFQITSTNNIDKIKNTLKQYVKYEFYKKFDTIYIYNLIEKQNSYHQLSIDEIKEIVGDKFLFDLNINILDRTNLERKIKTLSPISKIEKIHKLLEDQYVYRKKSLLSLEIWESNGKLGYGFSNLLNGIDLTTYTTLFTQLPSNDLKDIIQLLLTKYNSSFALNFENNKSNKFINLGFNTYLSAAFLQTSKSFQLIKNSVLSKVNTDNFTKQILDCIGAFKMDLKESNYPLVNNPINHPAVQFVKDIVIQILQTASIDRVSQSLFIKDFNENIEKSVIELFEPENYKKHLEETKERWLRENEKDLLLYIKNLAKLGFVEGEEFQYQTTYGEWKEVRKYGILSEDLPLDSFLKKYYPQFSSKNDDLEDIQNREDTLSPVEDLIEEYFLDYKDKEEGYLNNILFLIADFGKGKTSFLRFFASQLAQKYLTSHEGFFPVYLSLNEFDRYSNSPSLGVIAHYLAVRFKIDIKDDYFKKKNYFFLIDSLDECGELSESNIERVIKDIAEIQNLDNINQRNNRILITSRPISKGLKEQINKHKPFTRDSVDYYLSIYGFKAKQFDNYIEFALKKYFKKNHKNVDDFSGLSKSIFTKIYKGKAIGLFKELHGKILKGSELKRPIFAYMIYKLLVSNSNFIDFGKVGVYISFLNQLSRDAKHKDDTNHVVRLKDEFVYRNILHATALLWQYKRQSGEQITLTKADICRTIEEKEIDKDNRRVLLDFHDIDSVHFLSHSYLGEKEDTLHFQHQSFAEILLAEYYLKVFIKYAIEENTDIEEARMRLSIGLPTDQSIEFFKGLLSMLKECVHGDPKVKSIYDKRVLLIPLLASISTRKHNKKLYSTRLNATWFEKHDTLIFESNKLTDKIIEDFPITQKILDKIEDLSVGILNSKKIYFLGEPKKHTVLFNDELTGIDDNVNFYEIDKWFALITGNAIGTDLPNKVFFNNKIQPKVLFNLIHNWNKNYEQVPDWGSGLFCGINMENTSEFLFYKNANFSNIDFSYSYLKKVIINDSNFNMTNFSNCTFQFFNLITCNIRGVVFDNIDIINNESRVDLFFNESIDIEGCFALTFCSFNQGLLFPQKLNEVLKGDGSGLANQGPEYCIIQNQYFDSKKIPFFFDLYFGTFRGIYKYIMRKGLSSKFILASYKFQSSNKIHREVGIISLEEKFIDLINEIELELKKELEKTA